MLSFGFALSTTSSIDRLTVTDITTCMALAIPIRRVWRWVIALYKFLWHRRPTLDPNVFASLFRRFVVLLKIVRSKWQTWYGKRFSKPPFSNPGTGNGVESRDQESELLKDADVDQTVVVPLDNISCSLYPYGTGLHSPSRSLQVLNASRSSHNLAIISRSQNASRSSQNVESSQGYSPLGGGYTFTVQPTSPRRTYSMSSPELMRPHAADLHDTLIQRRPRTHQNFPHPRSNSSVESIQLLSPGEISSTRDRVLPSLGPQIEQSTESPCHAVVEASSQTHTDDLEIPALDHHCIYPVVPEFFQRYEKRRRIPKKATRVKMNPLVMDFSDHLDPPGWTLRTHPEGAFYFYNAAKRIFTDVDLYDSVLLKRIEQHIEIIETFINRNHISIPEQTDLVLDINLDENGSYITDYYFANHQLRIIFFLDYFTSESIPNWEEIKGVSSGRHLRHKIEAQYWWHCLSYPDAFQLTDDLVCEFRAIVMHYIGDSLTSPYANSPYTVDDLYKILSLADSLKENVGKPYSGCTSLLSRYMFVFSHVKFLNFYGQPEARLNRDQSVHGTRTNRRTWFIKIISIFLFSAPDVHLRLLQKMWIDGIMHKAVWEASLKILYDEWREFILYATVMLNANVAFLQIARTETLPAAQLASYCSMGTSIGSIILGLLLVRQNQTKNRETATDVEKFLRNKAHPLLGLETLAIMFSLPYALLMWSMVTFLVAFLLGCFQDTNIVVYSVVGALCGVITILVAWCIWTSWEEPPASDAQPTEESLPFEEEDSEIQKKFTFEVVTELTEEPQPSVLGLSRPPSLRWPSFLHRPRQESYDSNQTVVEIT